MHDASESAHVGNGLEEVKYGDVLEMCQQWGPVTATGHSCRRTGAMNVLNTRFSTWYLAWLGRWASTKEVNTYCDEFLEAHGH